MTNEQSHHFRTLTTDELKAGLNENAYRKDNESRRWFSQFEFARDAVNGNPHIALRQGLDLLNRCRALDEDAYKKIHKGGAFYWLGIASFLVNEYELATFFFDAAVSEDIRWGDCKNTPAMLFMQLDGENVDQAAKQLTEIAQNRIDCLVTNYNDLSGDSANLMSMQILRERLFIPSLDPKNTTWRSIATTFISFALEWDYRNLLIDIRIESGTFEPFYFHLFKGCLLFESLLKENPTRKPQEDKNTLNLVLKDLHKELGIRKELKASNKKLIDVFDALDKFDNSIVQSITIAFMTRNTLGHNVGWEDGITKIQYQKLFMIVANSCLHVIACLY